MHEFFQTTLIALWLMPRRKYQQNNEDYHSCMISNNKTNILPNKTRGFHSKKDILLYNGNKIFEKWYKGEIIYML